jgi:glutamate:GABA antiporter
MAAMTGDRTMATERLAPGALPRVLNSFDMTVIFIAIVLFIVQASALQPAGPAVFTYWVLGFVLFLIPGALVTAQLGQMFPQEGSLYVWTQKALGPFWGFFAGFCAWWPGVLVMVASSDLVVTIWQFIDEGSLPKPWHQGLVILAVLWFSAAVACMRLRLTQNYVNFQFVFYAAAIFTIGLAGVLWLVGGGHSANRLGHAHDWLPTGSNWTFFGLVILALLGIEVPLNMGVEIVHPRAIKKYLFWGSAVVIVAYLWATFGNIVTIPLAGNNSTTGILSAVQTGFWGQHWFAVIVGLVVLWFFISNTVVYNYSFSRLLFVSGLERRMPQQLAKLEPKTHVPRNAVILQTVLASIFTIVTFGPWSSGSAFPTQVYLVFQAAVTVIWCISMVLLFADVFLVRRSFPEKFEQVRVSHTGALFLSGVVGIVASAVGAIVTFKTPWNPDLFSNGSWRLWLGLMTAISAAAAIVIYAVSEWVHRREKAPGEAATPVS